MASLGQPFDPKSVAPDKGGGGGAPHPKGIFQFEIQESNVKANSKGTGKVFEFTAVGTGSTDAPSDNKGRKVFGNINVEHSSAQAQTIGQAQLSALCAACEYVNELIDTEQLHYLPFWAEVDHELIMSKESNYTQPALNGDGTPKMKAVFKRFMFEGCEDAAPAAATPPEQKAAPQAQAQPQQQATPPANTGGGRTWQRKAG